MGKNLYVFGDSFCAHNENWIKRIQIEGNFDYVYIFSIPGSSLTYTLEKLYTNINKINKSDGVIVGMTDHARQYLSGFHLRPFNSLDTNKIFSENPETDSIDSDIIKSYEEYLKYFYDDFQTLKHLIPTYHYVKKSIPKLLKTKKFVSFYTMFSNPIDLCAGTKVGGLKYNEFLPVYKKTFPFAEHPGMFEVAIDFTKLHKLPSSSLHTNNHWIDHPSYEEYFWDIYKPLFNKLWLN